MRSGIIDLGYNTLRYAGIHTYNWSNLTGPETTYAYYLNMNKQAIYPSGHYYRYVAFPVLSYVRSGYITPYHSTLKYAGIGAYAWSRLSQSETTYAYDLGIYNQSVGPSSRYDRYNAFPSHSSPRNNESPLV